MRFLLELFQFPPSEILNLLEVKKVYYITAPNGDTYHTKEALNGCALAIQ